MTEMGSPEIAFVASPDRLPKRSGPPKSPVSDSMERPTYLKFLVSNSEAGSVIGKGGSTITDFQSQTGSRIQLSRSQEYFPGTSDRIIMISGTPNEVLMAMECILLKLCSEIRHEEGTGVDPRTKVRIIVPNSSCGALIGKGGATIKSLMEDSQAGIKISPQDNGYYGLNDRLVMVTGSVEEQMRAIDLILSKLIDDPHYSQSMNSPFAYPGVPFSTFHPVPCTFVLPSVGTAAYTTPSYVPNGGGGKFQNNKDDVSNSLTIGVDDEHIGVIVGRGGRNIADISQASGARIKISDRGDFIAGTNDRKVTISGSEEAVQRAESMIMQKVASLVGR